MEQYNSMIIVSGKDGFVTFAPCGSKLRSCRHRAGGKQSSTGALHFDLRIRLRKTKKLTPKGVSFFVVGEDGFEPSKRNAADLQSVPFGHSGTPPYLVIGLEPVDGLEPPTY